MGTVSFFELVQTLACFIGALWTWRVKVVADLNLVAQRRSPHGNGNRLIIAETNVRRENTVLFAQVILCLGGLATLFQPNPSAPVIAATRLPMFLVAVALMRFSYKNWLEVRIPQSVRRATDYLPKAAAHEALVMVSKAQDSVGAAHEAVDRAEEVLSQAEIDSEAVAESRPPDEETKIGGTA